MTIQGANAQNPNEVSIVGVELVMEIPFLTSDVEALRNDPARLLATVEMLLKQRLVSVRVIKVAPIIDGVCVEVPTVV